MSEKIATKRPRRSSGEPGIRLAKGHKKETEASSMSFGFACFCRIPADILLAEVVHGNFRETNQADQILEEIPQIDAGASDRYARP